MLRDRLTGVQIVLSGLLSVLLAVAVNVATGGDLPGPARSLAWLAWPVVGLLAVTLTAVTLWQHRRSSPSPTGRAAQLPAPRPVVGRTSEIRAIAVAARSGAAAVLVTGVPGAGKTSLALRAAHDLRRRFPDGQLYADLRGSDPDPAEPGMILVRFLRALGETHPAISADEPTGGTDELAARFRTAVAGRRLLIVLDDAGSDDQVAPLLPGAGGCLALVTSRRQLSPPDGRVVRLGALGEAEGRALLAATVGSDRVRADPAGAARIVAACGGLPLAVQLAGARLRDRPGWTLGDLADRLGDERRRLGELSHGDAAVRGTFRSAFDALPPSQQLVFRRAGAHPGKVFGTAAAAALTGLGEAEVTEALDRLADAMLVECPAPDRYRLHDLLRLYAHELFAEEPQADRDACVDRLLAWLTATAAPGRWRADELDNVLATLGLAVRSGRHAGAWELADAVHPLLTGVGDHVYRLPLWTAAAAAAGGLGDDLRRARATRWVAHSHRMAGDLPNSRAAAEESVALAGRLGDAWEIAQSSRTLGETMRGLHRFDDAKLALTRSLDGFAALGHPEEEVQVRTSLAGLYNDVGRPAEAIAILQRALPLLPAAEPGDHAWLHLGFAVAYRLSGREDEALRECAEVTSIAGRLGDDFVLGYCHQELGWIAAFQGRYDDAEREFRRMRALLDGVRNGTGVSAADAGLGSVALMRGRPREALRHLDAAIDRSRRLGDAARVSKYRLRRAEALAALGREPEAAAERSAAETS